jgi:xylan 1,4-beta-xylosidase
VHDSYIAAAYILTKLKATRAFAQGMSYWTFSDLFEEAGPPPSPFHGGFGLINREGIRKPAFFAYKYLNQLRGREVPAADAQSLVTTGQDRTAVLLWDWQQPKQELSNRPFFTMVLPAQDTGPAELHFSGLAPGSYRVTVRRTGFKANDAHTRYLEMGSPDALSPTQLAELRRLTGDTPETSATVQVGKAGSYSLRVSMRTNDVVLAVIEPVGRAACK